MHVQNAICERRVYRSLVPVEISNDLIKDLTYHAGLAPSCFNNQPWRYIFVYEQNKLEKLHEAFSKGNEWAKEGSMIIAVYSNKEYDCIIHEREYFLFDTGMATAFLILRATELGLVAHPIAGYSPQIVRKVLDIPKNYMIITLIIVGKHSKEISLVLSDKQKQAELNRPKRKSFKKIAYINTYKQ